jgi:hypothetical protein
MKSSNNEVTWTLLKVMAAVAGLGIAIWYAASVWSQASAGPQPMMVRVALDNQCGLVDDAFVAVAEPDGTTAAFDKGVAVLHTRSDAKIMVRALALNRHGSRPPPRCVSPPNAKAAAVSIERWAACVNNFSPKSARRLPA